MKDIIAEIEFLGFLFSSYIIEVRDIFLKLNNGHLSYDETQRP